MSSSIVPISIRLSGGLDPDSFEEVKGIADATDVRVLPDGSGVHPREGTEIRARYQLETSPAGRVALVSDALPERTDGATLRVAQDTVTGAIRSLGLYRPADAVFGMTLGLFALTAASYSASVGDDVTFTVQRYGYVQSAHTVRLSVGGGDAVAGSDYAATDTTLTFAIGETSKTVTMATYNTGQMEDKLAFVTLSNPSQGAALDLPSRASITLVHEPYVHALVAHTTGTTTATTIDVQAYNAVAESLAIYRLGGFTNAGTAAGKAAFFRVGTAAYGLVRTFSVGGGYHNVYLDVYDFADIVAAGPRSGGGVVSPRGAVYLGQWLEEDSSWFLRGRFAPCASGELVVTTAACPKGLTLTATGGSTNSFTATEWGWVGVVDLDALTITHSNLYPRKYIAATASGTKQWYRFQTKGNTVTNLAALDSDGCLTLMGMAFNADSYAAGTENQPIRIAPAMDWDPATWNAATQLPQANVLAVRQSHSTTDVLFAPILDHYLLQDVVTGSARTYDNAITTGSIRQHAISHSLSPNAQICCAHADGRYLYNYQSGATRYLRLVTPDYAVSLNASITDQSGWPAPSAGEYYAWLMDDDTVLTHSTGSNQVLRWPLATGSAGDSTLSYGTTGSSGMIMAGAVPDPFLYNMRFISGVEVAES